MFTNTMKSIPAITNIDSLNPYTKAILDAITIFIYEYPSKCQKYNDISVA